jgi:hypothetical protein
MIELDDIKPLKVPLWQIRENLRNSDGKVRIIRALNPKFKEGFFETDTEVF